MRNTTVIAPIVPKNAEAGNHFFVLESNYVDFAFNPLTPYAAGALSLYEGTLFVRTGRVDGYVPGTLPTQTDFWTDTSLVPQLSPNDQQALAQIPEKLTARFVTELPANPQEEVLYVNTVTQEGKIYQNGQYIQLGSGQLEATAPYEFQVPVPIILGFNTNLDTGNEVQLYFPAGIKNVKWDIDRNRVANEIFYAQTPNGGESPALPSDSELQIWIDDNTTATTGFYLRVVITPVASYQGEITGSLTYFNTVSVPTVITTSGGTGWASYKDNQYTEAAPFRLLAGQEMILPNNAGVVMDDQLPLGVSRFYNAASQKLLADRAGDGYNYQFVMLARPTVANAKLDFGVDIGGNIGKIFNSNYTVAVDAGVIDKIYIPVAGGYAGDTFKQNGGQVKITASQDVDVWGMAYVVSRYHQAR